MSIDPIISPLLDLMKIIGTAESISKAIAANDKDSRRITLGGTSFGSGQIVSLRGAIAAFSPSERSEALDQFIALAKNFRDARKSGSLIFQKSSAFVFLSLIGLEAGLEAGLEDKLAVSVKRMGDNTFKQPTDKPSAVLLVLDSDSVFDPASTHALSLKPALKFLDDQPGMNVILIASGQPLKIRVISKDIPINESIIKTLTDGALWLSPPTDKDSVHRVSDTPTAATVSAPAAPNRTSFKRQDLSREGISGLQKRFVEWTAKRHVTVDESIQLDLLAAFLSSQFLLFAGPSGTGKSTLARAVTEFFTPVDSFRIVEGRRQLIGPEDVVGFYSHMSGKFVTGTNFQDFRDMGSGDVDCATPVLIVDEINLSPIEGYLNPFVHGYSTPSVKAINWEIAPPELCDDDHGGDFPCKLTFQPYPRLIGTINVDASAFAPSPKVASRACVILLKPRRGPDPTAVEDVVSALIGRYGDDALGRESLPCDELARQFVGNPVGIFAILTPEERADLISTAKDSLARIYESACEGVLSLSHRQYEQVMLYVAWYFVLSQKGADLKRVAKVATENACLHFVLPSLSGETFGLVIQYMLNLGLGGSEASSSEFTSVLSMRLETLSSTASDELFGASSDFWDRLS